MSFSKGFIFSVVYFYSVTTILVLKNRFPVHDSHVKALKFFGGFEKCILIATSKLF